MISILIILTATGLYAYWLSRAWLLSSADEDTLSDAMEVDWYLYQQARLAVRAFLGRPLEDES